MDKFSFEDLNAYKYSRALVKSIYTLLDKFPYSERNALTDQLRRAVISVPSNIAEGMGRMSTKEQVHFIEISYGSLMEVLCQIQLAKDLDYISAEELSEKKVQIQSTAKLISGLRSSLVKTLNSKH
jgi:four helix bundle protein